LVYWYLNFGLRIILADGKIFLISGKKNSAFFFANLVALSWLTLLNAA
jgi:hypothetical protein